MPHPNPFPPTDADRHAIWEMLVRRDIAAFLAQDGEAMSADFEPAGFLGLHAHGSPDPDGWRLDFTFASYKAEWLRQAREAAAKRYAGDLGDALFAATRLEDIDINGDMAVAHKKFDGSVTLADGTVELLKWQTLYLCRRTDARWKIVGFTGYMPNPMPGAAHPSA